jgi:hypothetical protein
MSAVETESPITGSTAGIEGAQDQAFRRIDHSNYGTRTGKCAIEEYYPHIPGIEEANGL